MPLPAPAEPKPGRPYQLLLWGLVLFIVALNLALFLVYSRHHADHSDPPATSPPTSTVPTP